MPNQLSIPFKKTWNVPIKQAARDYIYNSHLDAHPDEFKWDINRWEALRRDGVGGIAHVDRIKDMLSYHAQLVFILTKLPPDIGLEIAYAPVFASPSSVPITLKNLLFERASVVFNLGALHCQLAGSEDRSTPEGLKRAATGYQAAAGVFSYLVCEIVPKLQASLAEQPSEEKPWDLSEQFVKSLEWLMLAQAQECAWQRANMDGYKNLLVSRLSSQVALFYESSAAAIREAPSSVVDMFPSGWLPHLDAKRYHFEAAAQYRKSLDDLEANRYGHELARLKLAQRTSKTGYDIARRAGVVSPVLHDSKSLLDVLQKDISRSERDNYLIYHHDVPSPSALPSFKPTSIVHADVPPELLEPNKVVSDKEVIFGELLARGAREAISLYENRKEEWLKSAVYDRAQELNDEATKTLRILNLPTSLDALERPIGLPPSLLRKAEEVRTARGPVKIRQSIEDVQKLYEFNMELLEQAMDILDQEATEDEVFQQRMPDARPPSHVANTELVGKGTRYRGLLEKAHGSDQGVIQKWDDWEENIIELTFDEAELEAAVPSTTITPGVEPSPGYNRTSGHARTLRALLEDLDDIIRARANWVARAKQRAENDDIKPRILRETAGIDRWDEVQPAVFEDVFDEELTKFHKYEEGIKKTEARQTELLETIKEGNDEFLRSRKDDPILKEREHALQSLELAYHKYIEIVRNLDEGLRFYNGFSHILNGLKHDCRKWVQKRQNEASSITQSLGSMSLEGGPHRDTVEEAMTEPENAASPTVHSPSLPPPTPPPVQKVRQTMDLPRPDSSDWDAIPLPPGPPLQSKRNAPRSAARR